MTDKKTSLAFLTQRIKQRAYAIGFDHCRITAVQPAPHADFFAAWIAADRAGEMGYLERNLEKRYNPAYLAATDATSFRSIIVVAANHHQFDLPAAIRQDPSRGIIAAYAWGDDYHELIRPHLYELDAFIRAQSGRQTPGKCLVDTGPVLERDWAHQVGLGFTGKNCCTIHPQDGSWLLLATILVPEELAYDPPLIPVNTPPIPVLELIQGAPPSEHYGSWHFHPEDLQVLSVNPKSKIKNQKSHLVTCGRCTRCLSACPTDAFVGPFHLDPQRCISYWTIEAQAPIPRALRPHFGNHIFGCDICQEVCPWNQRLPERNVRLAGLQAQQTRIAPPLLAGFEPTNSYWLDELAFRSHFRHSPIKRAKRAGMLRNVAVALGNWADPVTVPALTRALHDPADLPRGHAAWALGCVYRRHQIMAARDALLFALATETVPWVRKEIEMALEE